jgi:hypothetical protein
MRFVLRISSSIHTEHATRNTKRWRCRLTHLSELSIIRSVVWFNHTCFVDHMSASSPEAQARSIIDKQLQQAGWIVQDRAEFNPAAGTGIAVREFPLRTGFADYLLLVDRKAVGAVEAKKVGTPLSGVEAQSAEYSEGLPEISPAWRKPLPFLYESTGVETFFTNGLDPDPRSRRVFSFHRPETLRQWVTAGEGLRSRLLYLPPLAPKGLSHTPMPSVSSSSWIGATWGGRRTKNSNSL